MRNKALHTIFPDNATAPSDRSIQTAFADLLPAQQSQSNDTSSSSLSAVSRSSDLFGPTSNPAQTSSGVALPEVLTDVSKNLDRLRAITEAQITETTANTSALGSNTAAKSVGQAVASVGKAASGFLGGLTSFPLISGLVKLFGGGSDTPAPQPVLPKYEAPASLAFDRAVVSGSGGPQIGEPTYDRFGDPKIGSSDATSETSAAQLFAQLIPNAQDAPNPVSRLSLLDQASLFKQDSPTADPSSLNAGDFSGTQQLNPIGIADTNRPDFAALLAAVRAYAGPTPGDISTGSANLDLTASPGTSTATANTTQITVNVQAMDSRSFLDRSHDIAQAVREAMLNMHSINDVVNDL